MGLNLLRKEPASWFPAVWVSSLTPELWERRADRQALPGVAGVVEDIIALLLASPRDYFYYH